MARWFAQNSTWYQTIANSGIGVHASSADYVNYLQGVRNGISVNHRGFSIPVWQAVGGEPADNWNFTTTSQLAIDAINNNGWNLGIPFVSGETPASGTDGHMTVINSTQTQCWDWNQANVTTNPKTTLTVKRYDMTGDGIDQPYTYAGGRVSPTPLLHGLIMKSEIDAGVIDHCLAFGTDTSPGSSPNGSIFPCVTTNLGNSSLPFAPPFGFRFYIDGAVDVSTFGLNSTDTIIAKAIQDYGMMMVIITGPGENVVYAEDREDEDNWAVYNIGATLFNNANLWANMKLLASPITTLNDPHPLGLVVQPQWATSGGGMF